jgi:putative aldouronate transport system substrate-binding protein
LKGTTQFPSATYCTLIRQDWLDKLKLKMPTTVQELHDVLTAFVKAEPDGQHPTYGLTGRVGNDNFWSVSTAYGNPNIDTGIPFVYIDYATKKLVLWNTSNAARAYFKEIVKWYREGLIDKEFLMNNTDAFFSRIKNGVSGTISHQANAAGWLTTEMRQVQQKTVPELAAIPALKGTGFKNSFGGEGGTEKMQEFEGYWGISIYSKNIDNVLKLFDFETSPKFNDFAVYGLEGLEYHLKNGAPVMDVDYIQNKTFSVAYGLASNKATYTKAQNEYIYSKSAGEGDKTYDPKASAIARTVKAYSVVTPTAVPYQKWASSIPGLPIEDLHPDVNSPIKALIVKMIIGELDANKDSDWKTYLKAVNDTGINDIIKEKEKYLKKNSPKYFDKW